MPISSAPAAFERFRGWLIRRARPTWPNMRLELHSSKAAGTHLHDQQWRLWFDQSNFQGLVLGFTSHQRNQRFHFQWATQLLRQPRDVLFPVPDYNDLVAAPRSTSRDEEDPLDDDPPLLPYVNCSCIGIRHELSLYFRVEAQLGDHIPHLRCLSMQSAVKPINLFALTRCQNLWILLMRFILP